MPFLEILYHPGCEVWSSSTVSCTSLPIIPITVDDLSGLVLKFTVSFVAYVAAGAGVSAAGVSGAGVSAAGVAASAGVGSAFFSSFYTFFFGIFVGAGVLVGSFVGAGVLVGSGVAVGVGVGVGVASTSLTSASRLSI